MASVREHTQANDNEIKNILNKQSIELILHNVCGLPHRRMELRPVLFSSLTVVSNL